MSQSNLPPLTWLRAFDSAARHLSFTLAGKELGLTQSAVSQHIQNLESYLGRDLFIRKTRALDLTEAGANYLPVVQEAFAVLSRGTEAFVGGDRGRTLRLQCNMAFSIYWLTPRLPRLYEKHPWLVLNIITPIWDPERNASSAAVEIRFGLEKGISPSAQKLIDDRFFPVCAPDYQGGAFDLDSARLFDCSGITGSWSSWFDSRKKPFTRSAEINLGSTFVISLSAALAGAGFSMGHHALTDDLISSGQLVAPFDHRPRLSEAYFLMPPASHDDTPASRAFVEWLNAEMAVSGMAREV
ncbi:LysR family transcriptional regulator [Kiloniella sp. b19]|uniref:LysR family transcriptional regulator n=1 Tax=Kiloniella sp. GXU_MW_B19 TaxID=3141326 RepID=UPI0031E37476